MRAEVGEIPAEVVAPKILQEKVETCMFKFGSVVMGRESGWRCANTERGKGDNIAWK
jgi:hypothetical protein